MTCPQVLYMILILKNHGQKKEIYEFDEDAKKEFLKGAQIAYETIITSFASGKISEIKSLLNKDVYNSFNEAIKERSTKAK